MAEKEYFVRNPDSENARGPFTMDKLVSLADAGQFTRDSLIYDEEDEKWKAIRDNSALCAQMFPEKKKLTLRRRDTAPATAKPAETNAPATEDKARGRISLRPSENQPAPAEDSPAAQEQARAGAGAVPAKDNAAPAEAAKAEAREEEQPPILSGMTVDDYLNAADGQTEELKQQRRERDMRGRAAGMAVPLLATMMFASSVVLLFTDLPAVLSLSEGGHWMRIVTHPHILFGFVDILFALLLVLGMTGAYPFLRFRLMLGFGLFGYLAFATLTAGNPTGGLEIAALAAFSFGVYCSTLTLNIVFLIVWGLCALAGLAGLCKLWLATSAF